MREDFIKGYTYVTNNIAGTTGAVVANAWIDTIEEKINIMFNEMITASDNNRGIEQDKGFIAEIYHTHTYNINAHIHHSTNLAERPDSHASASPDIKIINKENEVVKEYSLKYYKTPSDSHKAQTILDKTTNKPKYSGQEKLIPTEHLEPARIRSRERINSLESNTFPTKKTEIQIASEKEFLKTSTDVVSDSDGNSSLPLTNKQAINWTKAAKAKNIDKELVDKCRQNITKEIPANDIVQKSLTAGLSAATLSMSISIAPIIIDTISMLIAEGEIDAELLKSGGIKSLTGSTRGFLSGSLSAAITACCKTGKLGEDLIDADPLIVSSLVVITMGTIESAIKLAAGKIDKGELARELMQMYITTVFSYVGGTALAFILKGFPLAYMLGSFVGSIIGGYLYKVGENLFLSFCIESGCTFFGLVDQNYELPQSAFDELGLEQFDFEHLEINPFQYNHFKPNRFSFNQFNYNHVEINILRRDLIGVYNIGYV